jgi:Holliday junction resolvase-like predicted endonuclease
VDRHKRREVAQVAREYLRRLPPSCQWRFDIVSVYYAQIGSRPQIEVFRNASLVGVNLVGVEYEGLRYPGKDSVIA